MELAKIITYLADEFENVHFQFVNGHSGIGPNCLVDELINAGWQQYGKKVAKIDMGIVPQQHKSVSQTIREWRYEGEAACRSKLRQKCESVTINMQSLGLDRPTNSKANDIS